MSARGRARFEIVVDMVAACVWSVFEGLWVGIQHASGVIADQWRQTRIEWAATDHLGD